MRTHRRYFDEDIRRAESVLDLAQAQAAGGAPQRLVGDLRLQSIAMAVGALDAYFCDAYVDCLTSVLRSYVNRQWQGKLPAAYARRELPAGVALDSSRQHRPLWSLRMAARAVMERGNMLSLSRVPEHFNGILPDAHKLWVGIIDRLIAVGYKRFTGFYPTELVALVGNALGDAKKRATSCFQRRIGETIQLRHDWAHNVGRPRAAINDTTHGQARARIREIRLFIEIFDDHLEAHRLA